MLAGYLLIATMCVCSFGLGYLFAEHRAGERAQMALDEAGRDDAYGDVAAIPRDLKTPSHAASVGRWAQHDHA